MNAGVQERFHAGMNPQKIDFSHQTFLCFTSWARCLSLVAFWLNFKFKNSTRFSISLKMFSFIYMGFSRQGLIRSFWEVDLFAGFWLIPNLFLNQKSCIDLIIILKMTWSQISPIDHTCPVALSNQRHLSPSKIHTITPA